MSLEQVYDPESFRELGHQIVDQLADYLKDAKDGTNIPVVEWHDPEDNLKYWSEYKLENALSLFDDIIARSMHVHHKTFMGHQVAPASPLSALAGLVSSIMSNGMAVYEMGPSSSAIEKVVTTKLARAMGYTDQSDGFLTSGGTLANLTALLTARSKIADLDVWNQGHENQKLAVMVSSEAHYCIDRAARIMGLGSEGILKIPVNGSFQMRTETLEDELVKASKGGLKVFAIIGSACTTSTGSYDNLNEIADFAEKHGLWLHVDGAHGAAAALTTRFRHLVDGIERADSITLDCHKMLMTPSVTTALLFKNGRDSYQTFHQRAEYLWEDGNEEWFNLGKRTFECTKLMMSIKFFCLERVYGIEIFDEYVSRQYELARQFAELISSRRQFHLGPQPESNIVCFRLVHSDQNEEENNHLNSSIRERLLRKGDFYIVQTKLGGQVFLRTTLMNPFTTVDDLGNLLDEIEVLAQEPA